MFFSNKIATLFRAQKILNFLYMMWYMKQYQLLLVLIKVWKSLAGICKSIKDKRQKSHQKSQTPLAQSRDQSKNCGPRWSTFS